MRGLILSTMKLRKGYRRPAERLRRTVEALPPHSREAMLRGIESNRIIAGAYADSRGGICPMLAAHRNGGRTDLSGFAIAWDFFTGARKPRRATRRELAALRGYLELSLLGEGVENPSRGEAISDAAARIRRERNAHRAAALVDDAVSFSRERPAPPTPTGERDRTDEFSGSDGWAWIRPARRLDTYRERVAAASEEHSEHSVARQLGRDQVENAEGSPGRV